MSDAIFIVGYYRSGTSALSGALHRLGVMLHNDADANEHNPLGFYEIPELIEFDVDLFAKLGVEWTDIRGLPEGFAGRADAAPFVPRLEEIMRRRFGKDALWGLKHPHLCRLLPIYETAARQAGARPHAVHILRNPWAVAASQARKNQLSRAHAVLLWVVYLTEAEQRARHLPRSWLTYEDLLADPAAQLRRIGRDLGLGFAEADPAAVAAAQMFLSGELNRSVAVQAFDLAQPLRGLVEDVWAAARDRDYAIPTWDGFAARGRDLVGLLKEIGESQALVLPGFGHGAPVHAPAPRAALRPAEREDEGARRRLAARHAQAGDLPRVAVLIAAPPRRAHAIGETMASLTAQWLAPDGIEIIAVDDVHLPDQSVWQVGPDAGALTARLCGRLNELARAYDYVAILNAGDTVAPDACLRFALTARGQTPDMIYCDEMVPADAGTWVRHKPAWDVTRLRQSAYVGDWVWYGGAALARIGGFDAAYAGVEEYEVQLRLAEAGAAVARLPEALFRRAALSRRDNIPSAQFGQRALDAVSAHLNRSQLAAEVFPRAHLGLFGQRRDVPDPGTATLLLCDHADVPSLEFWTRSLLSGPELTGPIILAGAGLAAPVASYLEQVAAASVLRGKIMAVPPAPSLTQAEALRAALVLTDCKLVAIIDAAAVPGDEGWAGALRGRLADPAVAIASGRSLIKMTRDAGFMVAGPIIRGADTRLGAGHVSTDPGPGGWLAVDQEAGAVAPGGLLVRRAALAACQIGALRDDALWIDLCAQLRDAGHKIVWTPDVSFIARSLHAGLDLAGAYRGGSPAARALPAADAHHHPSLSLRGDLLAPEQRHGLIPAAPEDAQDVLLTGPAESGLAVVNAMRALRMAGVLEASWAPEPVSQAELARRAPSAWVRINPEQHAEGAHAVIYTRPPAPDAQAAIAAARSVYATSPAVAARLRARAPEKHVTLWRPSLSAPVWADFAPAAGLNTRPRLLWVDENIAPAWLPGLITATLGIAAWIVVERADRIYAGEVARLKMPADEQGWARDLAAVAPHVLVRPAGADAWPDQYVALVAAAAGCQVLADDRLDIPASLAPTRLKNDEAAWRAAIEAAVSNFAATLEAGAKARAACLALQAVETAPPGWAGRPGRPQARTAAA